MIVGRRYSRLGRRLGRGALGWRLLPRAFRATALSVGRLRVRRSRRRGFASGIRVGGQDFMEWWWKVERTSMQVLLQNYLVG
jgi:hypothetical protein